MSKSRKEKNNNNARQHKSEKRDKSFTRKKQNDTLGHRHPHASAASEAECSLTCETGVAAVQWNSHNMAGVIGVCCACKRVQSLRSIDVCSGSVPLLDLMARHTGSLQPF